MVGVIAEASGPPMQVAVGFVDGEPGVASKVQLVICGEEPLLATELDEQFLSVGVGRGCRRWIDPTLVVASVDSPIVDGAADVMCGPRLG